MNIIHRLRLLASCEDDAGMHFTCEQIDNIANKLEQSGALVPVPDGKECRVSLLASDSDRFYIDDDGDLLSCPPPEAFEFIDDFIVQPVRLVPLKDWEG